MSLEKGYRISSEYAEAVTGEPISEEDGILFLDYEPSLVQKAADFMYRAFTGFKADTPSQVVQVENDGDVEHYILYDSEEEFLESSSSIEELANRELTEQAD